MRPRRRHQRFVRRLETEFIADGKLYRAISSDFSRSGLFVRTNRALAPGTEVDIVVHLPDGTKSELQGVVRRAVKTPVVSMKNGMGVELTKRDDNYVRFIKDFDPTETNDASLSEAPEPSPEPSHPDTPEFLIIPCKACGIKNRVRHERLCRGLICGKCGSPISLSS